MKMTQSSPASSGQRLPESYNNLGPEEIRERGIRAKKELGDNLLILAHHYQQDDVFFFKDVAGDSLYLAQQAAKASAKYIVFCGVHFMAESSDIITADDQVTILPDLNAGCPMADMADLYQVEECWEYLTGICGEDAFVPVTYINSSAALKAFCGKHGGTVCTSSNAERILRWALDRGKKVLFFPDQYLGRNTAQALNVPDDKIALWKRHKKDGALTGKEVENSQVILWDGYCIVHLRFTTAQIQAARQRKPGIKVIVHPECPEQVVQEADYYGSTGKILKTVAEAEPGSQWAIGTEVNMVNRLAADLPDRHIEILNPAKSSRCVNMSRIEPQKLIWVLESLLKGEVVNPITVSEPTKSLAKLALDRMLELSE